MPSPTFGALVDIVDQVQQGNFGQALSIYMTQSMPADITIGGMRFQLDERVTLWSSTAHSMFSCTFESFV